MANNAPYDYFFHLFMSIELVNGQTWTFDKQQVLTLKPFDQNEYNTKVECIPLGRPIRGMTLNKAMEQMIKKHGIQRTVLYDPINWNCQIFSLDVLTELYGSVPKSIKDFIYQDVSTVFTAKTGRLMKSITDLGAWFDKFIHGSGIY